MSKQPTAMGRRPFMKNSILFGLAARTGAQTLPPDPPGAGGSSAPDFEEHVPVVRVVLDSKQQWALRGNPRDYADAKVSGFAGGELRAARVKLKGSEGSYEPLFLRPCFTIKLASNEDAASFMGLRKFHLNNSRQDKSCLRDWLATRLARQLGIPVGRVGHARVELNGKPLGLYALKEACDEPFLTRTFGDGGGNLYEATRFKDIQTALNRTEGKRQPEGRDLAALAEACAPGTTGDWRAAVEGVLNVDQFLAFAAFEFVAGQWDGYVRNLNNFRLYFNPADQGRAHFLLHGMDQALGPPAKAARAPCRGRVYRAVLSAREWEARYHARVLEYSRWLADWQWLTALAEARALHLHREEPDWDPANPESGLPSLLQEFRLRSRFLQEELNYLQRNHCLGA